MIQLTPAQMHAKDIVSWLVSNHWSHKASGRTMLLAICFIEEAIKNPGAWILVWDHGPHHPKKELHILNIVKRVVEEHYPSWNFKMHVHNTSFCMEKK